MDMEVHVIINILEENVQRLCDLGLGKGFFLDTAPKTLAI